MERLWNKLRRKSVWAMQVIGRRGSWRLLVRAVCGPPLPLHYATFGRKRGYISKKFLRFWNFGFDFLGAGGDVWRWLCRHVRRKFPLASIGGWAEGLACADPAARTPIGASGNLTSAHIGQNPLPTEAMLVPVYSVQIYNHITVPSKVHVQWLTKSSLSFSLNANNVIK